MMNKKTPKYLIGTAVQFVCCEQCKGKVTKITPAKNPNGKEEYTYDYSENEKTYLNYLESELIISSNPGAKNRRRFP